MGFFTLDLARLVGRSGRVIAVEIQRRMLDALRCRAAGAGALERLDLRLAGPDSLSIADLRGVVSFTLAFAVVHELPSAALFFLEVAHDAELQAARKAGFKLLGSPPLRRSRTALLEKE
jgi:hypothetical protein